jgi:TadE-like protein
MKMAASRVDTKWNAESTPVGWAPVVAAAAAAGGARRPAVSKARGLLHDQRGQGLIEMGMVVALFVILSIGIIEFGRVFMLGNMVTHTARDAGRAAAIIGASYRNPDGSFLDPDAVRTAVWTQVVEPELQSVLDPTSLASFSVSDLQQLPDPADPLNPGDIPRVQLTLTGQLHYIFNLVGNTIDVSRTVSFRDEGRSAP